MKHKIITILSLCLFLIGIVGSQFVYAESTHQLLSGAAIINSDGSISVVAQTSRYIYYVDLDPTKTGTITLTYNNSINGNIVFSTDDVPEDIQVGYTFISDDITTLSGNAPKSVEFSNVRYAYITTNRTFTCEVTYNDSPGPSPSISPSPSPEVTPSLSPTPVPENPGSNIPYHFAIPLDYYFVVIIILLGGVLICQFFKK